MLVNKFEDWGDYKISKKINKSKLISILTDNMILVDNIKLLDDKIEINIFLNEDSDLESLEKDFKKIFGNIKIECMDDNIKIEYPNRNINIELF